MIVSDSGPIIAFSRIGRMDILRRLFGQIIVPNAVYEELVIAGKGKPGAAEVRRSSWIQSREVRNREGIIAFPSSLHRGEREAIVLAHEFGIPLLIDERRGRRTAVEMGINVIGSLAILAQAHKEGIIEDVPSLIQDLLNAGYWINPEIVDAFLAS
jgi:predicted nucleic acid-binding protein